MSIKNSLLYSLGSPPRMRGKLSYDTAPGEGSGITPAHAGKTIFNSKSCLTRKDHPRACGENLRWTIQHLSQSGSPPRMRGKHARSIEITYNPGITPAHAGKTRQQKTAPPAGQDHPRACGENKTQWSPTRNQPGSPPRMRGKPDGVAVGAALERITPAHAGKTQCHTSKYSR